MDRRSIGIGHHLVVALVFALLAAMAAGMGSVSAGVAGGNALTFKFDVCKPGGIDCVPYANTDARIKDLTTGIETYATNDANGWISFGHLEDGSYAFSTPAVLQQSITTTCTDAYGAPVASWMGADGPTVALSDYVSVTCVGQMIPATSSSGASDGPTSSLTFRSIVCPEGSDICTPYSPAESRFMPLATGTEVFDTTDAEGWSAYWGLADGEYAFSNPAVVQKSVTVLCTDAADATVPSWIGWAGPTVALSGAMDVTCTITLVPFDAGAPTGTSGEGDAEPSASAADSLPVTVSITILECPAGYTGSDYSMDCGNPVDASRYTGQIAWGTIPNDFHVTEAVFNDYGHAAFYDLVPETYSFHAESTSATVAHVACEVIAGVNDEGTWVSPPLGSAGYEVAVGVDGGANCYFSMIPDAAGTVPADDAAAEDAPVTGDAAPTTDTNTTDTSTVGGEALVATATTGTAGSETAMPVRLPNTGSGVSGTDPDLTGWIIATVIGAVLALGGGTVVSRVRGF